MSFINPTETQTFLCGLCMEIAHDAMLLRCHLKHHKKDETLYCSKCAKQLKHEKCPLTQHLNPVFDPALKQRQQMRELDVRCPYAVKEVIADEDNSDDKRNEFYFDTDHENIACEADDEGTNNSNKHNQNVINSSNDADDVSGCNWIGKYKYLFIHIDNECKWVPTKHKVQRLQDKIDNLTIAQMENKMIVSSNCRKCILWNLLLLFVVIGMFGWFWMQTQQMNQCETVQFDEINHLLDKRSKALHSELNTFKIEIMNTIATKLKQQNSSKQQAEEPTYATVEDIAENVKSKLNEYKNTIDNIPFVQFVSNTISNLKNNGQKKDL